MGASFSLFIAQNRILCGADPFWSLLVMPPPNFTSHLQILMQIVDFSCIAGHYRNLSEQPIPVQMWRQWKVSLSSNGLQGFNVR